MIHGAFVNKLYKENWEKIVPGTSNEFKNGTYASENSIEYAVYDGAANYMGKVNRETGIFTVNGEATEYKLGFLLCAKDAICG